MSFKESVRHAPIIIKNIKKNLKMKKTKILIKTEENIESYRNEMKTPEGKKCYY